MFAVRYSENIKRDFRRGYSYAGWGITPFATRSGCNEEWPHHEACYSRELGGWVPALRGLCAAGVGDTPEEALENMRTVDGMEEAGVELYAFECRVIGTDEYDWDVVVPTGAAKKISR